MAHGSTNFVDPNVGLLSNEQIVVATQLDGSKWKDLLKELRKDQGSKATFEEVYLIDDFVASEAQPFCATTKQTRILDRKTCVKFRGTLEEATRALNGETVIENKARIHIHHYVALLHMRNQ